jgi:hypothetical protein
MPQTLSQAIRVSRHQLRQSIAAWLVSTGLLTGVAFGQAADPCAVKLTREFQTVLDEHCKKPGAVCDVSWNLRQTGILKAREILVSKGKVTDPCEAGKGIAVAQIDTGIVDSVARKIQEEAVNGSSTKTARPTDPVVPKTLHSHLDGRPGTVLYHAKDGTPLPLAYEKGFDTAIACKSGELSVGGERCAARDKDALHAPRDGPKGFSIPMLSRMPGHGTRTMSVLLQAGPSLAVAPYRFANSILVLESRNLQLADAILSAAFEDRLPAGNFGRFDVVTMSLGRRSPSPELERAALVAESRGLILVAAAGQFLYPTTRTRFPAAYAGVISATGSTIDLKPWTVAGRGDRNTVAAPASGVWRATWDQGIKKEYKEGFGPGKGTSFAAPLVAATAAMWVQLYGRDYLDHRYGRATVPAVFKWILKNKGHRQPSEVCAELLRDDTSYTAICGSPQPWDREMWGRGILAADKVLNADLPTRTEVCDDVLKERGFLAFQTVCLGVDQQEPTLSQLTERVTIPKGQSFTYLFGGTLIGTRRDDHFAMMPAVSMAIVFAGHEYETPAGLLLQLQAARNEAKLSFGRGWAGEYSPFSPRQHLQSFPVFGPTLGAAIKFSGTYYRREDQTEGIEFGPELQLSFYRFRLQVGYAPWSTDREPNWNRFTWGLGFGF